MVKPLIEIITGEDWITHTKLTEEQKKLKAMGIFVDVSMFLFSFVTGGESLTAGSLVKALMVEMVTGMSTVGVTRFANAYNLSPGVTMLLMFLVGTFTGVAANSAFDFIEDGIDDWVRNNPLRQLVEIQDWLGVTTIVPDALGRALKVTDYANRTVEYEWGAMGERKSMSYPDGKRVSYDYNEKGQLSQLADENGAVRYAYDDHARLKQKLYPNGTSAIYAYDSMGHLAGITNCIGQSAVDILAYDYDKAGNMTKVDRRRSNVTSGASRYEYDATGRLIGVYEGESSVQEYRYDEFGNRIYSREGSEEVRYYYNNLNQLIRTENGEYTVDYGYDKRGNMVKKAVDGVLHTVYTYDARNQMSLAENTEGKETRYFYNGLGKRIGQMGTVG